MRGPRRLLSALGLVAAGALAVASLGSAAPPERQPVTLPCATNAFVQVFGRGAPAGGGGQDLVLARVTFEPGGGIGPHTHPGTLVQTVESGTFGFTLLEAGEMMVMRAGGAGTPAAAAGRTEEDRAAAYASMRAAWRAPIDYDQGTCTFRYTVVWRFVVPPR